jgi:hypothetical protein
VTFPTALGTQSALHSAMMKAQQAPPSKRKKGPVEARPCERAQLTRGLRL